MDKDCLSHHQPETMLLILAKTSPNPDSCLNRVTSIFSSSCIIKYFERLNRRKSHGPQSSHPSQKLCICFSETLSGIFSRSFISSRIPDVWRQAPFSRKASDVCQTTTDQSPWLQCHRTYCNYVNSNPVTMA